VDHEFNIDQIIPRTMYYNLLLAFVIVSVKQVQIILFFFETYESLKIKINSDKHILVCEFVFTAGTPLLSHRPYA